MSHSLHLQPFLCFLTVFVLKVPLKLLVKSEQARRKRESKAGASPNDPRRQIKTLESQISDLDPVSDFVKVSKLKRKIIALNKQL